MVENETLKKTEPAIADSIFFLQPSAFSFQPTAFSLLLTAFSLIISLPRSQRLELLGRCSCHCRRSYHRSCRLERQRLG